MSNFLKAVIKRAHRLLYRLAARIVSAFPHKRHVTAEYLYPIDGRSQDWLFHDSRWPRIVRRFQDRREVWLGKSVVADDTPQDYRGVVEFGESDNIKLTTKTLTTDEWLYLHLDPQRHQWKDFSWEFEVRRFTLFREMQFAFRYRDFYNRYRYRFEDNRLFFDFVINGRFFNSMSSTPFVVQLGRWYQVSIVAIGNRFQCYVDGRLLSSDIDFSGHFPEGPIAIVLWEDDGTTPIQAEMRSLRVRRLERR